MINNPDTPKEEYVCSECGKDVAENDKVCPHCGADLSVLETSVPEVQDEEYYCTSCNKAVAPNDTVCPHCGVNLSEGTDIPVENTRSVSIVSLLLFKDGYIITPVLFYLNIFYFIYMVMHGVGFLFPDSESVLPYGANFSLLTMNGEWWRLFTSCFIHFGIIHLLMNMYALLYIGMLLEPLLGKYLFIAAYLLTCLTSSVTSLFWHQMVISAGASGAIFGMFGVFLALLTTKLIKKEIRIPMLKNIALFIVLNIIFGMKGNIDNAAHIGGLLGGVIIGYAFYFAIKNPRDIKIKSALVIVTVVLILIITRILYANTPKDMFKYEEQLKAFSEYELLANQAMGFQNAPSEEAALKVLKETGVGNLEKGIKVIQDSDTLNLPKEYHQRNKLIIEFCNGKIDFLNYFYNCIQNNVRVEQSKIDVLTKKLDSLLTILNKKK